MELLPAHGVAAERIDALAPLLGELVSALGDVKRAEVSFLELKPFDAQFGNQDDYATAVVNIFTRLNSGGRALTQQEITFAWIKSNWNSELTGGKTADECFKELQADLAAHQLPLDMDKLVSAVSDVWAVLCNGGQLLSEKDLLTESKVLPMAANLASRWSRLGDNFRACATLLESRELAYRRHFESLNSFVVLAAWRMIGLEWVAEHSPKHLPRVRLEKQIDDLFRRYCERWLVLTQWARRWSGSTASVYGGYIKQLSEDRAELNAAGIEQVTEILSSRMNTWLTALAADADTYIENDLHVDSREEVHLYFLALWVWHRLNERRWAFSRTPLAIGKSKIAIDVDHLVSVGYWTDTLKAARPASTPLSEDDLEGLNDIGNCCLLEKNFNITKGKGVLAEFVAQLHEFSDGQIRLPEWQESLRDLR